MKRLSLLALLLVGLSSAAFLAVAEEAPPDPGGKNAVAKTPVQLLAETASYLAYAVPGGAAGEMQIRMQIRIIGEGMPVTSMTGGANGTGNAVFVAPDVVMLAGMSRTDGIILRGGEDENERMVVLPGGKKLPAKVLGKDNKTGAVFLGLDEPLEDAKLVGDMKAASPSVGDPVFVVSRLDKQWKFAPFLLPAVISGELESDGLKAWKLSLPGSQLREEALGALVVDAEGKLVGLVENLPGKRYSTVVLPLESLSDAINTAIDNPEALTPLEPPLPGGIRLQPEPRNEPHEQPRHEEKPAAFLGVSVSPVTEEDAQRLGLAEPAGLIVNMVGTGSPAEKAGLKKGDVILEADGVVLNEPEQLKETIAAHMPGDVIELLIFRNGEEKTLKVTLGKR